METFHHHAPIHSPQEPDVEQEPDGESNEAGEQPDKDVEEEEEKREGQVELPVWEQLKRKLEHALEFAYYILLQFIN